MLGKLLKYEFKGLITPMLIMLAILLGTTVIAASTICSITPDLNESMEGIAIITTMFSFLLYYIGIIGCSLGMMIIIGIRFYKTCYTDQGYLTHTLPVTTHQLVGAKTIASVVSYLIVFAGMVISIISLVYIGVGHVIKLDDDLDKATVHSAFGLIDKGIEEVFGKSASSIFGFYMVCIVIGCISAVMIIMGCVSLGQMYTKHRIIGAILAYFIVMFAQQIVNSIFSAFSYASILSVNDMSASANIFDRIFGPQMICMIIFNVIVAIVLYFVNIHMMTKRLNLE